MGHLTRHSYRMLQRRMDRSVPGIFDSEALYEILSILFTEEDARLCCVLPLAYFTVPTAADIWAMPSAEARLCLEALADKGLVYSGQMDGERRYLLAPPVLGFFEFSLMRTDGRFDRARLVDLYHRYIDVEEGFAKAYAGVNPPVARTFVHEDALAELHSEVLDFERVQTMIERAGCITTGTCFCRYKMRELGMGCDHPLDVCLTFNGVAKHLAEHGIARRISKQEAHDIIDRCVARGLVQIGDNKRDELVVICNCCGCCCDMLGIYKRFGATGLINPSNYIAEIDAQRCSGCGTCVSRCPVDAIELTDAGARVKPDVCLGCGVCTHFCPEAACRLRVREQPPYVPQTSYEKVALQAIDQAKIGNFLFDDPRRWYHHVLRCLVNSVLRVPGVRRFLLRESVRRRLLNRWIRRDDFRAAAGERSESG